MSNYTFANLLEFEVALTELPSGYQKVEYIESSGTQYIDTGIVYQYANAYNIDKIINTSSTSNYYGNQGVLQIDMSIFSSYTGQKIKVSQRNTGNIRCSIYIDDVFKQYGYDMSTHSEGYSYRVFSLGHYGTYSIYKCYYFKCYVNAST